MTEPTAPTADAAMTAFPDLAGLVEVQTEATVSRTVLRTERAKVVVFAFDADQELTEHTAAVPALLQTVRGHLQVTADGRTLDLVPGGLLHLRAREPHAVRAVEPSILALTMLASP